MFAPDSLQERWRSYTHLAACDNMEDFHVRCNESICDPHQHSRALVAYQDFLSFGNDADPDIPILKEAKAEYAKLQ